MPLVLLLEKSTLLSTCPTLWIEDRLFSMGRMMMQLRDTIGLIQSQPTTQGPDFWTFNATLINDEHNSGGYLLAFFIYLTSFWHFHGVCLSSQPTLHHFSIAKPGALGSNLWWQRKSLRIWLEILTAKRSTDWIIKIFDCDFLWMDLPRCGKLHQKLDHSSVVCTSVKLKQTL